MKRLFCILAFLMFVGGPAEASPGKKFFSTMTVDSITLADTDRMQEAGIGVYRMSWDQRQSWGFFDSVMEILASRGIRMLPVPHSSIGGDWRQMPVGERSWQQFLRSSVERYGPAGSFWNERPYLPYLPIRNWQIWNEPNDHWFTDPVNPRIYTRLLRESQTAILSADPGAKIIAAGLFGPSRNTARSMSPKSFLHGMWKAGAGRYIDALALHPYARNAAEMRQSVQSFARLAHGQDIWITELGWQSDWATAFGVGSESAQARQLRRAYNFLLSQRKALRIRLVSWFALADVGPELLTCGACYGSGLLRKDKTPKEAFWVLQEFT